MGLSKKEQDQLAALQRKAEEPDEPDFEVEWWEETPDGSRRGGRLPWSKGKALYGKQFPDLFADKAAAGQDDDEEEEGKPAPKAGGGATRLFQSKSQAG